MNESWIKHRITMNKTCWFLSSQLSLYAKGNADIEYGSRSPSGRVWSLYEDVRVLYDKCQPSLVYGQGFVDPPSPPYEISEMTTEPPGGSRWYFAYLIGQWASFTPVLALKWSGEVRSRNYDIISSEAFDQFFYEIAFSVTYLFTINTNLWGSRAWTWRPVTKCT